MYKRSDILPALSWFSSLGWKPQDFQRESWKHWLEGRSGLLNAPTGSGKTYALLLPALLEFIRDHPGDFGQKRKNGLRLIWISPIRALTKEIAISAERACTALGVPWEVGIRTGDTSAAGKAKQKRDMPEILITTPESLHVMLAQKEYPKLFTRLGAVVVDEWHELLGSKRGVQTELGISRLAGLRPMLKVWGISATIGNLEEAKEVLLGDRFLPGEALTVKANLEKKIKIKTLVPDRIERFPWAGHLGIHMLEQVIPIIRKSSSTLIFTNVRSQCEIWYQRILDAAPDLAGQMAMHHGSVSSELRNWVEENLYSGFLKVVVCTSSLDLGVDFRPVETIIQIGSPKGVSRFVQRAGRSGHQPGKTSSIYFVPTHSLEILEAAALRQAISEGKTEERIPYVRSFDVLVQYLVTLAVSDGFDPEIIYGEIIKTFSFRSVSPAEFQWILDFITHGGQALNAYDEFHKVVRDDDGLYRITSRKAALQHRLSIGTIVSDAMLTVKYMSGKRIGTIEEWFLSRLKPGEVFWLAGRNLELVKIQYMEALVRNAAGKKGLVPSWMGGRLPLSSNLSSVLRSKVSEMKGDVSERELKVLQPLFHKQEEVSAVPYPNQFLMEKIRSREGCHLFAYPFEGRSVNEGIASLLAYRLSLFRPFTFSIAMNDYGFELLSDQDIPIEEALDSDIFTPDHLLGDLKKSLNANEMAKRKFRDIARISGLVFQGFPGHMMKQKHLQSNSQLFFDVFRQYEPDNLLLLQAYDEVMDFELEHTRLRKALERIQSQEMLLMHPDKPTPFSFPIMVDRLREKFTTENLESRIKKMLEQLNDDERR